jgi:Neutral/alkaline non-lysosomal ceramidase, N-terminal
MVFSFQTKKTIFFLRIQLFIKFKIVRNLHCSSHRFSCIFSVDELIQLASSIEATGGRRLSSISQQIRNNDMPKFVSAFCQSNCGDVSPNVLGTFCIDTGLPCDFNHSTCNGKNELCYGRGPGYSFFFHLL